MSVLKIAGAALNQIPLNWKNNTQNIIGAIRQAHAQEVQILCLPELCITGYGCEDMFLSKWIYETALEQLEEIRLACEGITVAVGLPILLGGKNFNTMCMIHDTQIMGFTAKQFLADEGVHYEPRWFTPWPANSIEEVDIHGQTYPIGDVLYDLHGIRIAFEICEDAWRGEKRPGYRHKEKGANLILNGSASHFSFGKTLFREQLVIPGSADFDCAYLFVNLLGNEAGRMIFDGEILIAQQGKLLKKNQRLSMNDIDMLSTDIDFAHPENSQEEETRDSNQKEVEMHRAATLALYDYLRKSFSKGFVLSLSGGADSSICAVLVSEMVKRGVDELGLSTFLRKIHLEHLEQEAQVYSHRLEQQKFITGKLLTTAYQATVNSSEKTFNAAKFLAESVGATFHHWYIDDQVAQYTATVEEAIQRKLTWEQDDITLQNIQARARSPIIWMLANINNALLLTTSNRSEGDLGYATMDGDTSGSIAPVAGVDKHFLLSWLRWAEIHLDQPGLQLVNNINPTAELRPLEQEQSDEADLMPYSILVLIERLAIRDRHSPLDVYRILKEKDESNAQLKEYVIKFFRLWSRNQWKRERIAPSFHLDDFNVDPRTWCRFPILSGSFQKELEELKNYNEK